MSSINGVTEGLSNALLPIGNYLKELGNMIDWEKIDKVAEPAFAIAGFAATVPYQLYQIHVVWKNMNTYEVGDPRRIKDPKMTIARRSLSAVGGVLGTIGYALGTGMLFAAGGGLKVATGVMCLYVNARLFLDGYLKEQELLKQKNPDKEALRIARYNKLQGAMGFMSSASYIGYFILTISAGMCPPVVALGALTFALSLLCAYLEKEGTREKLYQAKDIIDKVGFLKWFNGNYEVTPEEVNNDMTNLQAQEGSPEEFAKRLEQILAKKAIA